MYLCCVNTANSHPIADIIIPNANDVLPDGYEAWRKAIETRIERAKLQAILKVNSDLPIALLVNWYRYFGKAA